MNEPQQQAAIQDMISWLAHPNELGKYPIAIECVGEFEYNDMRYYIFKYKKSLFGKWLVGVCGGYENGALAHCGHVFSEMEQYNLATAKSKAIEMIECISTYWKNRAAEIEQKNKT